MKNRVIPVIVGIIGGGIFGLISGQIWFWPRGETDFSDLNAEIHQEDQDDSAREDNDLILLDAEQITEFGIEMATAGPMTLRRTHQLPGRIVLNADKVASIVPRVSGVVVKIGKTQGDRVNRDDVMAVINSRELADATADYLTAVQRVALSQATFDREAKLWQQKVSSEQEYVGAKQALAEAKITRSSTEQKLRTLGLTEDDLITLPGQTNAAFTHYEVRAPFAGTVIEKSVVPGEPVSHTSKMFRIADLRTVWVELGAHEEQLPVLYIGQSIEVKAMRGDTRAEAIVAYISPILSERTRMATVRVVLDNPDGHWRPGLFVAGIFHGEGVDVTVAVPHSAMQILGDEHVVFLETNHGFRVQTVETGREDSLSVEIIDGLKPGQRYAKTNTFPLKAEMSKGSFADDDD
jgi:cobalt-zinc-cadmium efflux system membrane fusion protein